MLELRNSVLHHFADRPRRRPPRPSRSTRSSCARWPPGRPRSRPPSPTGRWRSKAMPACPPSRRAPRHLRLLVPPRRTLINRSRRGKARRRRWPRRRGRSPRGPRRCARCGRAGRRPRSRRTARPRSRGPVPALTPASTRRASSTAIHDSNAACGRCPHRLARAGRLERDHGQRARVGVVGRRPARRPRRRRRLGWPSTGSTPGGNQVSTRSQVGRAHRARPLRRRAPPSRRGSGGRATRTARGSRPGSPSGRCRRTRGG